MAESSKLTIIGVLSGLALPQGFNELSLGDGTKIIRNPAAGKPTDGPDEMGANSNAFLSNAARYLVVTQVNKPHRQSGSSKTTRDGEIVLVSSSLSDAVTLSIGHIPYSSVSRSVPIGDTWDTPYLMQEYLHKAVFPLRLVSSARILVYFVGAFTGESVVKTMSSGLNVSCPEQLGSSLTLQLTKDDFNPIEDLSKRLADQNLSEFAVPVFFFTRSLYKEDITDRALDLIVALESLLCDSPESIGYKLAFRTSCLIANDNERWEKYSFVKKLYDNRSSLFHGRKKKSEDARKNLASNIKEIQDIVRKCLLLAYLLKIDPVELPSGTNASMNDEKSIDEYILTQRICQTKTSPLDSIPEIGKVWQSIKLV